MYLELKVGTKKNKPSRISKKPRLIVASIIMISWVVLSTLIIAAASIERIDRDCGRLIRSLGGCDISENVAVFTLFNSSYFFIVPFTLISLYIVYRLLIKTPVIKVSVTASIWIVLLSLLVIVLGVTASFAGAEANNRQIPSRAEQACADEALETYINTGVNTCGDNIDKLYNSTTLSDLDSKDDSVIVLLSLWTLYAIAIALTFNSLKRKDKIISHDEEVQISESRI